MQFDAVLFLVFVAFFITFCDIYIQKVNKNVDKSEISHMLKKVKWDNNRPIEKDKAFLYKTINNIIQSVKGGLSRHKNHKE